MTLLETVAVAFGMFSAVPAPQPVWNEKNMRYALCAFPLVGVVCGGCWWAWAEVCRVLALPELLRGAGFCLLPALVTGGIHLDGLADTSDALASHAPPEKKREILQDSRCGAFAVIRLCGYFIWYWALCCALRPTSAALWSVGASFVLSRSLSGLAIVSLPLAKNTGLAHTFAAGAAPKRARWILTLAAAAGASALCWAGRLSGAAMLAAASAVFWHYARTARKEFGGISGDLAGWFLVRAEWWMLAALVLCQHGEALL